MTTTKAKHTAGPWTIQRGNSSNPMVGTAEVSIAEVLDDVYPDVGQQEANATLIAAAPDMIDELRDTAIWLESRADVLLKLLADPAGWRPGAAMNDKRQTLRDEAARLRGRAAVIRQTILKATQGA